MCLSEARGIVAGKSLLALKMLREREDLLVSSFSDTDIQIRSHSLVFLSFDVNSFENDTVKVSICNQKINNARSEG